MAIHSRATKAYVIAEKKIAEVRRITLRFLDWKKDAKYHAHHREDTPAYWEDLLGIAADVEGIGAQLREIAQDKLNRMDRRI